MNAQSDGEPGRTQPDDEPSQVRTVALKVDNILEFLNANPGVAGESKDDAKCKALFMELGMLDLFRRAKTPNLSVLEFPGHQTHWIIGMCWSGYSNPGGNGYRVICLPKRHASAEDVKDMVRYLHERYDGYDFESGEVSLPYDWRTRQ